MTATEKLQSLAVQVEAQRKIIMEECQTLQVATNLMRRHGMSHIVEAVAIEAKQRVLRAQWANVTRAA